ncbi:hypothetical protein FRC12_010643 [Ceratobasidium sp. 428]|nr:hypothetical protein FRC12_010643 [Ceratobasidium sp. 428]
MMADPPQLAIVLPSEARALKLLRLLIFDKVTLADGTVETVYTWPTYVKWMIDGAKSKGATPIISGQTPNNPFEGVTAINYTPTRVSIVTYVWKRNANNGKLSNQFVTYAKNAAAAKGVPYVDHWTASLLYYDKLGKATTEAYFPNDHTHTNAAGANSVAWAFLSGLKCPSAAGVLSGYINSAGQGAGARCTAP